MRALIFVPPKNTMQSGQARSKHWVLRFDQRIAKHLDPLMRWTSNDDTMTQVSLTFDTREEAIAYAERHGIPYDVEEPGQRLRVPKSYADNFKYTRRTNWTH